MSTQSLGTESSYHEEEKLLNGESLQQPPQWRATSSKQGGVSTILLVLAALLTVISSFFAGALFGRGVERSADSIWRPGSLQGAIPRIPLSTRIESFHVDEAFIGTPKVGEKEPAWDSLIPNGLGYIANTTLATDLSVVAVFHQLHCLYTLRRAYYAEADQGSSSKAQDFDFGLDRMQHVEHCFEYLRQSLICTADSSIEPAEGVARGDHTFIGWDVPRQCRDYDQLKGWAEQRRAFDGHGFLAKDFQEHSNHER